jgi:hypothetical protein
MMSKLNSIYFLVFIIIIIGCSAKEPLTEDTFKVLHKSIYDAWELNTEDEIQIKLKEALSGSFLQEQLSSQIAMLKARQEADEQHKVQTITYHKIEFVKKNDTEVIVYTDYTIEGYRFHGDYHEQKSSHRIYWKLVHMKDGWKIVQIEQ